MKNELRRCRLGELLDVRRGTSLPGDYYSDHGNLIRLTLGNFNYPNGGFQEDASKDDIFYTGDVRKDFILKKGDIITPLTEQTYGLLGEVARIPEDDKYVQTGDVGLVLPHKGLLDDNFAYYLISSSGVRKQLSAGAQQTKIRHTSPDKIKDCIVFVPELEEQRKIGLLLKNIDALRQQNDLINETAQQQLKLMYDYWFSQFDFPDSSGNPYHTSGGKMVWNNVLKIEIPCGWGVSELTSNPLISVIGPGVRPFTTKTYLDTASIIGTDIFPECEIAYENRGSRANMQPTEYSVWFAKMKNSVKHLYLSPTMAPLIRVAILSTGFCGLQCDEISFEYIASFIEHSYFERVKDVMSYGATQEAANLDNLSLIPLVIPSRDVLRAYHDATRSIYAQIGSNICENLELAQLRDWLMPMLMNGQATIA